MNKPDVTKDRFGGAPKPTREARARPGISLSRDWLMCALETMAIDFAEAQGAAFSNRRGDLEIAFPVLGRVRLPENVVRRFDLSV
jgi:hypothetical protein